MILKNIISDIALRMKHPFTEDNIIAFLNSVLRDIRHCSSTMDITEFETTDADMYKLPDYLKADGIVAVTVDSVHCEPATVEEYTRDGIYYFPVEGYIAFYPPPPVGKTVSISHEVIEEFKTFDEVDAACTDLAIPTNMGLTYIYSVFGMDGEYSTLTKIFEINGTSTTSKTILTIPVEISSVHSKVVLILTCTGGSLTWGESSDYSGIKLSNEYQLGGADGMAEGDVITYELTEADLETDNIILNVADNDVFNNLTFTCEIKDSAQYLYDEQTASVRAEDADMLVYGALVQIANAREDIDLANNYKVEYNSLKNHALQRKYKKRGKYPVTRSVNR